MSHINAAPPKLVIEGVTGPHLIPEGYSRLRIEVAGGGGGGGSGRRGGAGTNRGGGGGGR